jgi:putative membrane protein
MVNKDLILRENLAIERTKMAQYRTFLAFIRTALYFPVAGITMHQAMNISYGIYLQWSGILIGLFILIAGIVFYKRAGKKIAEQSKHIGNYLLGDE